MGLGAVKSRPPAAYQRKEKAPHPEMRRLKKIEEGVARSALARVCGRQGGECADGFGWGADSRESGPDPILSDALLELVVTFSNSWQAGSPSCRSSASNSPSELYADSLRFAIKTQYAGASSPRSGAKIREEPGRCQPPLRRELPFLSDFVCRCRAKSSSQPMARSRAWPRCETRSFSAAVISANVMSIGG